MSSIATITYGISVYPEAFSNAPKPLAFIDALTRTLIDAKLVIAAAMGQGGDGTLTTAEDLVMALDVTVYVPVGNLAAFLDSRWLLPIIAGATITTDGDAVSAEEIALLDTLAETYPDFNWDTP